MTLEHSLRTELRSLREEMDESSFSRNINFSQLDSVQAEVRFQVKAFPLLKTHNNNDEKCEEGHEQKV